MVVILRILLPWPLRAVMSPWLDHGGQGSVAAEESLSLGIPLPIAMAILFMVLIVALGFADHAERLQFARFAIRSVRDLRAKAFKKALRRQGPGEQSSGDLVARLIGDTARLKAGLKGFLVHVATNGAMYVGITAVLFWIDPVVGGIFAIAGVILALCTALGAVKMFRQALEFRTQEGLLANQIERAWRERTLSTGLRKLNRSSGQREGTLTKIQGRFTWLAHIVLGAAVLGATLAGMRAVHAGRLAPGDLMIVLLYGVMLRAPLVQVCRQGVRTGKLLACGHRLRKLLKTSSSKDAKRAKQTAELSGKPPTPAAERNRPVA